MSNAIAVYSLGKQYVYYHPKRPTTLVETLARGIRFFKPVMRHWALSDINFTIAPSRMVGVIGANGAGKSTLLRLLGGVSQPDKGEVHVRGRIGALLDLGAGFHPDLTGRENLFISGVIGGLTRREVAQRFDAIVDFAELGDYIDNPLRTYSSGMQMRLAFAVATHIEPEILLVDEVLAVGDIAFQRKCMERIAQFKAQGCTIILVTHDPVMVQRMCDEAIWLREGKLIAQGAAEVVVGQYVAEMSAATRMRTPQFTPTVRTASGNELKINENRFGSQEMEITDVRLYNHLGEEITQLNSGAALQVVLHYRAPQPLPSPIFGITITREDGVICYESNTQATNLLTPTLHGEGQVTLQIDRLDFGTGQYYLDLGVYEQHWAYAYDYHWHTYPFTVCAAFPGKGVLQPPHHWRLQQNKRQPA